MKTNHFSYSILFLFLAFISGYNSFAQIPVWQLVEPKYPTVDAVVAGFVVDANEWGRGNQDATAYIQNLLDRLSNYTNDPLHGGGVVFLPEGHYRIDGHLIIPKGITLRGEWEKPVKGQPIKGTVIEARADRGDENAIPFIMMESSAALMDLAFWYPEQDADAIVPYPPTIQLARPGASGAEFSNVKNVTLVNTYGGIFHPGPGSCPIVSGVYGTPLKYGVEIDEISDVGRVEWCDFSPKYWAGSGLPGSPSIGNNSIYTQWVYNNSEGIVMRKNDWTYACYITVEGYKIGYHATHSRKNVNDVPNGHNYGLRLSDCKYGLRFESHADIGIMFTDVVIRNCEYGLYVNYDAGEILQLYQWDIDAGENNYAFFTHPNSSSIISLQQSTIRSGKVLLQGSVLLATDNDFLNNAPQVVFEVNARGDLIGNRFKDNNPRIEEKSSWKNIIDNTPIVTQKLPVYREFHAQIKKPQRMVMYNVLDDPFNVQKGTRTRIPTEDATTGIQAALNQAAADGGGIVYLPPGHYRINGSLTVPTGVELQGGNNVSSSPMGPGSVLEIYANENNPDGPSPVILQEKSGIRGVVFNYPKQVHCTIMSEQVLRGFADIPRYPYSIKGGGKDVYVVNVGMRAAYKAVDVSGCDNFYIDHLNGMFWKEGVYAKDADNGTIANMQCNTIVFVCGDEEKFGGWPNSNRGQCSGNEWKNPYMYNFLNLEFLILDNTKNTFLYNDFNYGTLNGIVLRNGTEGLAIGFGLDNNNVCLLADGENIHFDFINTQFCALQEAKAVLGLGDACTYIKTTSNFKNGIVNLFASDYGGAPGLPGVIMNGESALNLYAANFNQSGNEAVIEIDNGIIDMFCSQVRSSNQGRMAIGSQLNNLKVEGCYDRNNSGKTFAGYKNNTGNNAEPAEITGMLDRTGWIASASISNGSAANAIDGKTDTNWNSSWQNQGEGQDMVWFMVDARNTVIFNQILLDYSSNPNDGPQFYIAEVSDDGIVWKQIANGEGNTAVRTTIAIEPTTARYIRITKPADTDKANYWTITEFYLLMSDNSNVTPILDPYHVAPAVLPARIEAEEYDKGGEGLAYHDSDAANRGDAGFRTSEGVDISIGATGEVVSYTQAGEWIKYTVELNNAGEYRLNALVSSNKGASFSIAVNTIESIGEINVPNTGSLNTYVEVGAFINLERGVHELTLMFNGEMNIDYLEFKPAYHGTPFYAQPLSVPGTIEAEDFDKGGEGVSWHDTQNDATNNYREATGVKIETWNDTGVTNVAGISSGEWLRYTIQVVETGIYDIDCYVASPNANGRFRLHFPFELGKLPDSGEIFVPNTGGWNNWRVLTLKNMLLPQGEYCMEIAIQTGDFNLDKFVFHEQGTTDVAKVENDHSIRVYAAAQRLTVQSAADDLIREIAVYDVMGRLITMKTNRNQSFVTLDIPISSNFLVVKVRTEKASFTQKIQSK